MEWTKQRLAELLPGLEAPALEVAGASRDGGVTSYTARVNQVKSVTGEAMLTTRKGNKRFAFYDLKITLGWEAAPPPAAPAAAGAAEPQRAPMVAAPPADAAAEALAGPSLGGAGEAPGAGGGEADDGGDEGEDEAGGEVAAAAEEGGITGELTVGEFGSGSDHDDLEVTCTATGGSDGSERERLRRHVQAALWPLVLERLEQYVRELSEA
ncbi:hypothetical protein CHLNCDRAFT_143600 [Chlorella variabilis]|uniref:Activator of Hsp90 ATPase AHSA1-like N-terminal domain-containing protein n=1 Tax=Chlorella variabilis TaxID=554065 RepID=E1ZA29_CHLVA|nr:hypothetical protein CHLNCDRAFT_143600 [Chlorella variabilis]EFN57191.1 hypothetical protein CHLNCDRAFT_143600 [Chlorella variabilis]|eukprot:XP_005849293.1 hypothetical protein CHLNCDRAFT_143600 [Chlorella variabilis]